MITKSNSDLYHNQGCFAILGRSKCEYLSVLDLKDVYHTIKLLESFKLIVVF